MVDDGRIDPAIEPLIEYAAERKFKFPVIHDAKGAITKKYGVMGYPTAYLVGADGVVLWNGNPLEDRAALEALLSEAVAKAAPEEQSEEREEE